MTTKNLFIFHFIAVSLPLLSATIHHEQWEHDARITHLLHEAIEGKMEHHVDRYDEDIETSYKTVLELEAKLRQEKDIQRNNSAFFIEKQLTEELDKLEQLIVDRGYYSCNVFM